MYDQLQFHDDPDGRLIGAKFLQTLIQLFLQNIDRKPKWTNLNLHYLTLLFLIPDVFYTLNVWYKISVQNCPGFYEPANIIEGFTVTFHTNDCWKFP